ncbi:MAG: hypothetical protein ACLQUZ_19120 [Rhizomicrobium sp.]
MTVIDIVVMIVANVVFMTVIDIPVVFVAVVHHMLDIPPRLFVVPMGLLVGMLGALVIFANEPAVTGIGTALVRPAVALARRRRTVAAIALAWRVHRAVAYAIPAHQAAIVIAAPFVIAAIVLAAPPAHAAFMIAGAMLVTIVLAVPATPVAVAPAAAFPAAFVMAMPVTIMLAAMFELDLRHRIERVEENGIGDVYARIIVGAARFLGCDLRRHAKE